MRLRATLSSSQAIAAASSSTVTGVCGRGEHNECGGAVYAGHDGQRSVYVLCECECHSEAKAA